MRGNIPRWLYGPLMCSLIPALKGSEVWALGLYRVDTGYERGPHLRAHAKGPCSYPEDQGSGF